MGCETVMYSVILAFQSYMGKIVRNIKGKKGYVKITK